MKNLAKRESDSPTVFENKEDNDYKAILFKHGIIKRFEYINGITTSTSNKVKTITLSLNDENSIPLIVEAINHLIDVAKTDTRYRERKLQIKQIEKARKQKDKY